MSPLKKEVIIYIQVLTKVLILQINLNYSEHQNGLHECLKKSLGRVRLKKKKEKKFTTLINISMTLHTSVGYH